MSSEIKNGEPAEKPEAPSITWTKTVLDRCERLINDPTEYKPKTFYDPVMQTIENELIPRLKIAPYQNKVIVRNLLLEFLSKYEASLPASVIDKLSQLSTETIEK